MRRSGLILIFLLVRANAQQPTNPTDLTQGFTGVVRSIALESNGGTATLSIESGTGRTRHQIHCIATTQITKDRKPVALLQLKNGQKIASVHSTGKHSKP
jgi:hypothetical protein